MSKTTYDLIVIGAGSGGLGSALGMLMLGFKVLLIERKAENIGGECLNTGCVPSKALLHVAKQIHKARKASQFGLGVRGDVDLQMVKNYVHKKQDHIRTHENVKYLREQGMEVVLGMAHFFSQNEIKVNDEVFRAKNIVIATGSLPRIMSIDGAEKVPVFTNESVFDLAFLPEDFLFIGAGPVSVEMAQAFSRLGSRVHVAVRGNRILEKEDPEIARILLQKLREENIQFYFETVVKQIRNGNKAVLKASSGSERTIKIDALFLGIGRELDFESLKLQNAGIETKDGEIVLNDKLQTTNKKVYVSGDATGGLKFSHAAEMHNRLLVNNFILPFKKKLDLDHFPWVTFTDPEVATFGLQEALLRERNFKYERLETDLSKTDRAVTDDYEDGKLILFVQRKAFNPANARILGGSMIAPNAGEITQELVLANVVGLKLKDFMKKIYAYPTAANVNKALVQERLLKEIRPWMKKLITKWYRFKE